MPRAARREAPGVIHHVTGRSTGGLAIFASGARCTRFLELLNVSARDCGWLVYAHCLMSNHFHLLIGTPDANLGVGMRRLKGVFAQRLNREEDRRGAVWGERFHSRPVETEAHGLQTAAYIPLNPVKAGIVRRPSEWRWSSYRATAGLAPCPPFLAADAMLSWLDADVERARMRYRTWINATAARLVAAQDGGQSPAGTVPGTGGAPRDGGQSPAGTVPGGAP